jgi:hypothetical protein
MQPMDLSSEPDDTLSLEVEVAQVELAALEAKSRLLKLRLLKRAGQSLSLPSLPPPLTLSSLSSPPSPPVVPRRVSASTTDSDSVSVPLPRLPLKRPKASTTTTSSSASTSSASTSPPIESSDGSSTRTVRRRPNQGKRLSGQGSTGRKPTVAQRR